eukprot:363133-Chlamydomonas_euryale.AAC.13
MALLWAAPAPSLREWARGEISPHGAGSLWKAACGPGDAALGDICSDGSKLSVLLRPAPAPPTSLPWHTCAASLAYASSTPCCRTLSHHPLPARPPTAPPPGPRRAAHPALGARRGRSGVEAQRELGAGHVRLVTPLHVLVVLRARPVPAVGGYQRRDHERADGTTPAGARGRSGVREVRHLGQEVEVRMGGRLESCRKSRERERERVRPRGTATGEKDACRPLPRPLAVSLDAERETEKERARETGRFGLCWLELLDA